MKLLIIGGTGGTGKELITQALEQGHHLTALVRNPDKVKTVHPNLVLIKGDVFLIRTRFRKLSQDRMRCYQHLGTKSLSLKQPFFLLELRTLLMQCKGTMLAGSFALLPWE